MAGANCVGMRPKEPKSKKEEEEEEKEEHHQWVAPHMLPKSIFHPCTARTLTHACGSRTMHAGTMKGLFEKSLWHCHETRHTASSSSSFSFSFSSSSCPSS